MEKYERQPFKKYISLRKLRLVASNKRSFKKQPSKRQISKKPFFVYSAIMENLTLDELKTISEMRDIRRYESMSRERLISSINESKPMKEKNFNDARIEKIKKDFNKLSDRLSKPKIKEIQKIFME